MLINYKCKPIEKLCIQNLLLTIYNSRKAGVDVCGICRVQSTILNLTLKVECDRKSLSHFTFISGLMHVSKSKNVDYF